MLYLDWRFLPVYDQIDPTTAHSGAYDVGLVALSHGVLFPAAIAIVIVRVLLSVTGPVLAARERSGSTVERLAAFATWVDSGLAVGPLMSGFAVALVVHLAARRRA